MKNKFDDLVGKLFALLLLCALPSAAQAQEFQYTTNNGAVTITGYTGVGGDVIIPGSITGLPVTSIGNYAFYGTNLTSVMLPNSVTSVWNYAFYRCTSLNGITVDALNPVYSSMDGVLFNKSQTALIQYPAGKGGSYTIPNSVTSIESLAFYFCTNLTSVTIPNSVTSIGLLAFSSCSSLTSVTIPNSVTSIWNAAFYRCTSMASVTIPNSVTSISDSVFYGCTSLTSVTIPDSVTAIENSAFFFCTNLTNVTIPNSVSSIGGEAFYHCFSLTSVTIPDSVTTIGNFAFSSCTSLTSVTIPNGVTNIGYSAFYGCTSLTSVTIPNSVSSIGGEAFSSCTSLKEITMDALNSFYRSMDGVLFNKSQTTLIQYPAAKDGSYTIPNSVTTIGISAFSSCTSLTSVTIPNGVANIGYSAFYGCTALISLAIPDSVTTIGDSAFFSCPSLTSITIGNRVTSIGSYAFRNCTSLNGIAVDALNSAYSSVDGVLFNKSQTILIQYPGGKGGSYTVPNSVTSIAREAFYGCTSLTSVTIPNRVASIGYLAFSYCTNLTGIYFQGNAPSLPVAYPPVSVFSGTDKAIVYYLPGTTGWEATFGGLPTALWRPQTTEARFGVGTDAFGFTATWASGQIVVLEACTNLTSPVWSLLQTNAMGSAPLDFRDPDWRNHPARFYRLRTP